MGMTAEEFWYDVPRLAKSFREAQKLKFELMNQEAWLSGAYVYDAVAVAIGNALGGKGNKKQKYLEEPIELNPKQQTPEEAKQKVIDQLDAWKQAFEMKQQRNAQWK